MKKLIVIGSAALALTAAGPATADAAVFKVGSDKCPSTDRFPGVSKVRTVHVPAKSGRYRIPRWLVACSGVNWLQSHWAEYGRMPRELTLHGASWTVGTWKVRYRIVHKRWNEGTYAHIVLSKGRQRVIFNGFS